MRFLEEFNNAKALRDKHQKKFDKANEKLANSTAEWGSLEAMKLELEMDMQLAALERAEAFMETFDPF